jgi:hypothetical protein
MNYVEGSCKKLNNSKGSCEKQKGCVYYEDWMDRTKGVCFAVRDYYFGVPKKGDSCSSYSSKSEFCSLDGFPKDKCVYAGFSCRPFADFDPSTGFEPGGYHYLTGEYDRNPFGFNRAGEYVGGGGWVWPRPRHDPAGYDVHEFHRYTHLHRSGSQFHPVTGLDYEGYDSLGLHPVTRLNRDGLDSTGHDARGFRLLSTGEYLHRNGTPYGPDHLNYLGFDANGYGANGLDWNGYDARHFSSRGIHISGHNRVGIVELVDSSTGNSSIYFDDNSEAPLSYSSRGMDQLGRFRKLPHGPATRDERFDISGYNTASKNYLDLDKAEFEAHGYDAILRHPDVTGNASGLYPDDLGQLITNFNAQCPYTLRGVDSITDDEFDLDGTLTDLWDDGMGNRRYMDYAYVSNIEDFLLVQEIMNPDRTQKDVAVIKDAMRKYLKKSIYFCHKFLFAGDLSPSTLPAFSALSLDDTGRYIKDEMPLPDYKNYLDIYQRQRNFDFIATIKNTLSDQAILDAASYSESEDRRVHGHIVPYPRPSTWGPNDKQGVEFQHIEAILNVYDVGGDGKDFDKSRTYLRILAEQLLSKNLDEKALAAGILAHGGRHCHDAKRDSVVEVTRYIASDQIRDLNQKVLGILGQKSLETFIKTILYPVKFGKFESWIKGTLQERRQNEMLSPFANTWSHLHGEVGLPDVERVGYGFSPVFSTIDKFFQPILAINETNYPGIESLDASIVDTVRGSLELNGGFTKALVYKELYPSIKEASKKSHFQKIMRKVFGPLWVLTGEEVPGSRIGRIGTDFGTKDHPIMRAMLLRVGLLR